jgi:hypothetical protein
MIATTIFNDCAIIALIQLNFKNKDKNENLCL